MYHGKSVVTILKTVKFEYYRATYSILSFHPQDKSDDVIVSYSYRFPDELNGTQRQSTLKENVAFDQSSWSLKSIFNRLSTKAYD